MRSAVGAGWVVVASLFVSAEIISVVSGGRYAGMREVFDALAGRSGCVRLLVFVGWTWLGWHLFAR